MNFKEVECLEELLVNETRIARKEYDKSKDRYWLGQYTAFYLLYQVYCAKINVENRIISGK